MVSFNDTKYSILIAEDHPLYVEGLAKYLLEQLPGSTVKIVDNIHDLEVEVELNFEKYHLLILDLRIKGCENTIVSLGEKLSSKKTLKVVVLSMQENTLYRSQAAKFGAMGYISKTASPDEILEILTKVLSGQSTFSASEFNKGDERLGLTERELEILTFISKGLSSKQIGEVLDLSSRTVETHRLNMNKKTNCKNTAELINKATQVGIL